jgi:hypothetical protein
MAISTKYTFDQLYRAYREQYEKSEAQLSAGTMPKREMYSKRDFIADWAAIKAENKGMSGVRVAEKLARSDVYLYSKKQAQATYQSIYSEEVEERTRIQQRIFQAKEAKDLAKTEEERASQELEIKQLEKEERILKKRQTAYTTRLRTGNLTEEQEADLEDFYGDISEYYHGLKDMGYSSKEAKEKVAKKFFSWKYV